MLILSASLFLSLALHLSLPRKFRSVRDGARNSFWSGKNREIDGVDRYGEMHGGQLN